MFSVLMYIIHSEFLKKEQTIYQIDTRLKQNILILQNQLLRGELLKNIVSFAC